MSPRFLLTLFIALCPASPVYAGVDVERALEAFHSTCLAHGPDFDRTVEAARGRGWTPVSGDTLATLAPFANVEAAKAWTTAADDTMPRGSVVGVTRARLDGKAVQTCTVAMTDVDHELFLKSFFTRTDAEKIDEERNAVQISRFYILIAGGREQFVNLKFPASPTAEGSIVASSIADD
ncbi:MAG: hypothetical protein EOQ86_09240 [Mesorhizobium sp.]|uniref:hypothetical protein n=1 Tax=Mesorhizobium sp. TaxID=1871066 RepID=UPI000FE465D7|nr:hypothetical protein [Mesorhizobium sp.]RWH82149.1 MAG: hypothetical protein EOQ85_07625 [Mesorhizobium sp.]RWH85150.1 MAG: hypothetical protein EOQ86_09240 [Mesorhizobium sp.]RWH89905.1 MAG: hypothetical protein EOQ87_15305 [Mesorhizobium sp.]RWH98346.1 MAG: hypothetical protein EOQ88_13875 [Mesorhizobium sp.]RWI04647.1 MAG: hypothetical protein EOQ89_08685 [Mesorhizobium sp.]